MKNKLVALAVIASTFAMPALAQTAAQAAAKDPFVQLREDQRAANAAYAAALINLYADRSQKVQAAVEAAVKDADAKGKDPLIAKRNAEAKTRKATQADYDAALKKAAAERKTAMAEADKRFKAAGK